MNVARHGCFSHECEQIVIYQDKRQQSQKQKSMEDDCLPDSGPQFHTDTNPYPYTLDKCLTYLAHREVSCIVSSVERVHINPIPPNLGLFRPTAENWLPQRQTLPLSARGSHSTLGIRYAHATKPISGAGRVDKDAISLVRGLAMPGYGLRSKGWPFYSKNHMFIHTSEIYTANIR